MGLVINENDRILIVSPHPDDESIGCGGVMSLYRGHCDVLLATDGFRKDLDNKEVSKKRVNEFVNATDYLGVNKRIFLHIPEGEILSRYSDFQKIDFLKYKYIFIPNRFEAHIDHADLYKVMRKALKNQRFSGNILEYEVWTTIRQPNEKIDISSVVDDKKKAIKLHESQIKDLDYVGMMIGLNAYRGKGHGCDYAEVFYSEKTAKNKKKKERRKRIKSIIKK